MSTTELLRGELERLFELDEMKHLSEDLLGIPAEKVGGTSAKGAFARSLVEFCSKEDALPALIDAMSVQKPIDDKLRLLLREDRGAELAVGTVIEGFRITKKLGDGTVGTVYLAEKKSDDKTIRAAIKIVRADFARDRTAVHRFLTALRATKRIDARGLAPIHGVGELQDGRPYVITQFLDGQSLSTRIARVGAMHFNEARAIFRSLLDALTALHQVGLVHGDVKTENAFIVRPAGGGGSGDAFGVFVDSVVDRLLTRAALERGALMPLFGTPKGIAPELARGQAYDPRADLYAMGVLMYELLTGKTPFNGDTAIDQITQHLTAEIPAASQAAPRGWVAKELDEILRKALAKDPAARYQTALELREAIETFSRMSIRPPAGESASFDADAFNKSVKQLDDNANDESRAAEVEKIAGLGNAWDKAIAAFEKAAGAASDLEAKKALYFRIARIHEHELRSYSDAEKAYQKVIDLDASDEIALAGIEELRRQSGNTEGLVESLLEKTDRATDTKERAGILHEIAGLYENELKNPENAFVAWTSALAADPTDERTVREVARLAGSDATRWNEAVTTLGQAAEEVTEPTTRARLYTLLGEWYGEKLHRNDIAQGCFNKALEVDPAHEHALDGTIAIYRRAQAWPDLVALLQRRADASGAPSKARDFRAEAANILANKMNDTAKAIEVLQRVLKDDPAHPTASVALEELLARDSQWTELLALYEKKAASQRGEGKADTLCAMAELYEDRVADSAKAMSSYEAALAADPGNVSALKGLERVFAKQGKFDALLENLRSQLNSAATARQRIALHERIGALLEEEFVDQDKAIESFEQILAIDVMHENANAALGRLYRAKSRFTDLANIVERQAKATTDQTRKVQLLVSAAKVLLSDVHAPDRALALCDAALALDAKNVEVLELAARLKAQRGDTAAALDAVDSLVSAEKDPSKKADLLVRAGKILEEHGNHDGAIDRYKAALDADGKSSSASAALRAIFATRGDAQGAAALIERELETTEGKLAKAKLLGELGLIYQTRLDNPTRAKEIFSKAIELDSTASLAAFGLGEIAFEASDYALAVRYLEPLLARSSSMPAAIGKRVGLLAGDAFVKLGDLEKAQRAYFDARAIAPEDTQVVERVAGAMFDAGDFETAADQYKNLLKQQGDKLTGDARTKLLSRLGESLRQSGERDEAEKVLKEAITHSPADASLFEALASVYEAQGKWEPLLALYKSRMEHAADDERFALLVKSGDVLADKLKDKSRASKTYVGALELRGDDRNLLAKLMGVYSESKDWNRLLEVVLRISELVTEPAQLAKYYAAAGAISQFELARLDEAADYYDQALAEDPSHTQAWSGLVACLTKKLDWERLADAYRTQASRLESGATPEAKAAIYDGLGELLRDKLKNNSAAIEAFEKAQSFDTSSRKRAEMLADIYVVDSRKHFEKAVGVHEALLSQSPYRTESYEALRKIYADNGSQDGAWCAAQALASLNMAQPEEDALFKKHRVTAPVSTSTKLADDVIAKHLRHRDEDVLLTQVFAALAPAVIKQRAQSLESSGVQGGKKADSGAPIVKLIKDAANMFGVSAPEIYVRDNDAGGVSILSTSPVSIGLGKAALSSHNIQALAFVAARQVAYLRPGYVVRQIVPAGNALRAWLLAAIRLSAPSFPVPSEIDGQVEDALTALETTLSAQQQEVLLAHVTKLLHEAHELNLRRWVAGVDLSADRTGLLLAGDLETAVSVIKASGEESSAVTQKDRLKELYTFSVSEHHLALRKKLGVSIG